MDKLIPVGQYTDQFNRLTGQSLPLGTVYQSTGLVVHIQKRHPSQLGNIPLIPSIISSPDYIGKNPKEPDSVELVKDLGNNVMVCIKLDVGKGYLYVASVFEISASKLQKRVHGGRLKRV